MIGVVDVGGGMRGVYASGVYDFLLDQHIYFDYCIGVSAGSANLISYVSNQRGRNLHFYSEYSFRKEYMSLKSYFETGSYINLNYIYSTLSNSNGENPIDYETFQKNPMQFCVTATEAETGLPHYFSKSDIQQDHYDVLKASCAIPVICQPYPIRNKYYFDGGVGDPIPFRKAFNDGCDRIVVILSKPVGFIKKPQKHMDIIKIKLRDYPKMIEKIRDHNERYNQDVSELMHYVDQGKALIIAPDDCCGVDTYTRNENEFNQFYKLGYRDGKKIEDFLGKE